MAGKVKGITIEIGGSTNKLNDALNESIKKSVGLSKELKEVNKSLKFDPTNVTLLTQKQQILTEHIESTSEELKILKEAQAQVEKQFADGEIDAGQYRKFQRDLMEAEDRLKGFERALEQTNNQLDNVANGAGQTTSELDDLSATIRAQESELAELKKEYTNIVLEQGNASDEAKELESKMTALNDELKSNKDRLNDARGEASKLATALDDTSESADEADGGFTIMKGALADLTANAVQGAISSIGNLVGSVLELSEATEEYRQMQAKLEGASNRAGYSAEYATNLYKLMYQFLGDDQMATNAVTNLLGIGASQETLNSLLDGARGVWASYGDSIPIESLTEAINETIQVGKVTGTFADTINWVNISNEEMAKSLGEGSEAQKAFNQAIKDGETQEDAFSMALSATSDQQERANIVAQFLNNTYDESSETYEELAGSMMDANRAEVELKETQAELGEVIEPVNTAFTDLKNQALQAIVPLIEDLSVAFLGLLQWMKEHPVAMTVLKATVITLATAFGVLATALGIQSLIKGVTTAFKGLMGILSNNPATIWITAISALVAGFMYLWNTSDEFRNFWIELWNNIKDILGPIWDAIIETLSTAWNTIVAIFTPVVEFFRNVFTTAWHEIMIVWDLVKPYFDAIWNAIKAIFSVVAPVISAYFKNAWEMIKLVWNVAVSYFQQIWNSIKAIFSVVSAVLGGFFSTAWTAIKAVWNTVVKYFEMIWAGIKAVFSVVSAVLTGDFSTAWESIKNVWNKAGAFFKSIWDGIKNIFGSVGSWFGNVFGTAWNAIKSVFSGWTSFFSGLWSSISNTFSRIGTNIANAISGAVRAGINGVISAIEGTINTGINLINGAIDLINLLPGVDIGGISRLRLPRLAQGGFALGNSLVEIGEQNKKEVVLPLERNLGWADLMAKALLNGLKNEMIKISPPTINATSFDRQLDATYPSNNPSDVGELIDLVTEWFPRLVDASKHAIYLDGRKLVGETIDLIDENLALNYQLKERGI